MTPAPPHIAIRVILADDHPIIHSGLDGLFFADARIAIIDIATDFFSLLAKLATTPIDVLILDLMNMGAGPITMVRELRGHYPDIRILIFSSSIALASELLSAGALGYVVKEEKLNHLPAAIRAVAAGQSYLSPLVREHQERVTVALGGYELLPQEERVLKLIAHGATTKGVAANLNIDPRTALNYVRDLYAKTGCEDRSQLVIWYRQRYNGDVE
jgi:two-component system NarL family response regulator